MSHVQLAMEFYTLQEFVLQGVIPQKQLAQHIFSITVLCTMLEVLHISKETSLCIDSQKPWITHRLFVLLLHL